MDSETFARLYFESKSTGAISRETLEGMNMDPSHLGELIDLEDNYWWHVAKRELVTSIVTREFPAPARLVEGGIGSARNLVEFQKLGYDVIGFDLMPESVEHARQRGLDQVSVHDLGQPWPLEDNSLDVALMLDVLEHVQDPVLVMKHAARALRPGGGIVFTVPCYPWLYSDWDKSLGHFRRYTQKEMRSQASAAGLNVQFMSHWNGFTLPAALAVRGYEKLFPRDKKPEFPRVSPLVNRALMSMAKLERGWMRAMSMPAGLSLVGVLRK